MRNSASSLQSNEEESAAVQLREQDTRRNITSWQEAQLGCSSPDDSTLMSPLQPIENEVESPRQQPRQQQQQQQQQEHHAQSSDTPGTSSSAQTGPHSASVRDSRSSHNPATSGSSGSAGSALPSTPVHFPMGRAPCTLMRAAAGGEAIVTPGCTDEAGRRAPQWQVDALAAQCAPVIPHPSPPSPCLEGAMSRTSRPPPTSQCRSVQPTPPGPSSTAPAELAAAAAAVPDPGPTPVPAPEANLIVNFIPIEVTEAEFRQLFEQFGPLVNARIIVDDKGYSKGFGFVRFRRAEDATRSIAVLNGFDLYGKTLKVSVARSQNPTSSAGRGARARGSLTILAHMHQAAHHRQQQQRNTTVAGSRLVLHTESATAHDHLQPPTAQQQHHPEGNYADAPAPPSEHVEMWPRQVPTFFSIAAPSVPTLQSTTFHHHQPYHNFHQGATLLHSLPSSHGAPGGASAAAQNQQQQHQGVYPVSVRVMPTAPNFTSAPPHQYHHFQQPQHNAHYLVFVDPSLAPAQGGPPWQEATPRQLPDRSVFQ